MSMADLLSSEAARNKTEEEVRTAVRTLIGELTPGGTRHIEGELRLVDDLQYHSLALLELAFALEDEFDLSPIDEPTARRIRTSGDVERHVVAELRATGRLHVGIV
jgi:acyl carrier protein